MLNELKNELVKNDEIITVESYDLEEIINNAEEYYNTMSSLESTIETAGLMVNILNKYEFKNRDKVDVNEIDAIFTILGVNISAVESDSE